MAFRPAWASTCAGDLDLGGPDLQRVVLDPAGLGIDLSELLLRDAADLAGLIKEDGAATCGALVE